MKPERRRLYEFATYKRTERLENLTKYPNGIRCTHKDIQELFSEYLTADHGYGEPNLIEFALWVLGREVNNPQLSDAFQDLEPADVFW